MFRDSLSSHLILSHALSPRGLPASHAIPLALAPRPASAPTPECPMIMSVHQFLGVTMFGIGIVLTITDEWSQAFGSVVKEAGGGFVFLSLFMCPIACVGSYGSRNHNKFALLMYIGICGLSIFLMLLFGGLILQPTLREWDYQFQLTCLSTLTSGFSNETLDDDQPNFDASRCQEYFNSEMYAGFKLVWYSYYQSSMDDTSYKQRLLELQKAGQCCGLGRPLGCVPDSRGFPSKYPGAPNITRTDGGKSVRTRCGVGARLVRSNGCVQPNRGSDGDSTCIRRLSLRDANRRVHG